MMNEHHMLSRNQCEPCLTLRRIASSCRRSAKPRRAREAGTKIIETHSAHGYLLHEFLSPFEQYAQRLLWRLV
jgi:hypothetical protein